VRLFHTAAYLVTLPLLLTGWWLLLGGEGHPSLLSRASGVADTRLHVWLGRALAILALVPVAVGWKGIVTFVRESLRRDPGDGRWWVRWPAGSLTGRFARHEGYFDPGQRVANVAIVGGLLVLTATGIAMTMLHGGAVFAWLNTVHRMATFVVTPFIAAHLLVAFGVLPGYRGVWRSMHLGGRVPEKTARRIWPAWTERSLERTRSEHATSGEENEHISGTKGTPS
jgi:formate dehydrogenase subunit gamma